MNDLNELLKQRAEKKLKKEIEKFINDLREHKFFKAIENMDVIDSNDIKESLRLFFWNENYTAGKLIFENQLPVYIHDESKKFMEKVDTLQQDIDELKDQNI